MSAESQIPKINPTGPGYSVLLQPWDVRGKWDGWGCSLAWWANGVGRSAYEVLYADLMFTQNTREVPIGGTSWKLPGLGINIVRYNVGGCGLPGDIPGTPENFPSDFTPYKRIEGFEINWNNHLDPNSSSWNWSRDANQRSILALAKARGVDHFEFFSDAPMWWMTAQKSSAGGALQEWNRTDYMNYLATTVARARSEWGIDVTTVEPFNEPSAGWWLYPKGQEGCNLNRSQQIELIVLLRILLDLKVQGGVGIAASDENTMTQGRETLEWLYWNKVEPYIAKVNVHGYNGIEPWRDNNARSALRQAAGTKPLWMSEYGDGDGSGMAMAQSITEDINYLRPNAWVYWQPIEPYSGWGMINADYNDMNVADRAKPLAINTKYYVFAQFSRFIRPGQILMGTNDHNTIVGYDKSTRKLVFITVNYGNAQYINYSLGPASSFPSIANVTYTKTDGSCLFQQFDLPIQRSDMPLVRGYFQIPAPANSIFSICVENVTF